MALYTAPKAPEPSSLPITSSFSFTIRSCAVFGAVPLGVNGVFSSNGSRYNKLNVFLSF